MPDASFPVTGNPRALILLVEYQDVRFTVDDPADYFSRMVNEPGFSDYGGTGSALDFFKENSCGLFEPQFDVLGPVTLPQPQAYYGANDGRGDDLRAHMMVVDGCRALDSKVDFSVYDNDGDGYVDNVFVFYAGEAESSTGVADQVWPHTFFLRYASSVPVILDGVQLDRYACSNEWNGARGSRPARPDGVGTFVHEFSHVMGLPDLYSITYNSAFTPGPWSTLDYGPYNNDGCTPPNYSIFERYALGWMQPREITEAANVRLETIVQNSGAMIPTIKDTEFFLFENRQQEGWDTYLPGHGMLVWHIDYDPGVWTTNTVNTTVGHQYVDLEEADGMGSEETRADDAFPGGLERTSFTDTTIPSMLPWTGRSIGLPVTDITESADGIITFKVAGGRPDVEIPQPSAATEVYPGGFTAHWSAVDVPDCSYALSVYTRTSAGARGIVYVPEYKHLNVGTATSYAVTGLNPDTQYYYSVSTVVGKESSEPSDEIAVRTDPPTFDYLTPVALEASDISFDSFTARWEALPGAIDYKLYVTTMKPDGVLCDLCDFTGGLTTLPKGWSTTANSTYSMTANAGASIPSLRFTREGQELNTPRYTDGISGFEFWVRGVSTDAEAMIVLKGIDKDGEARDLATFAVSTTSGGSTCSFTDIPEDVVALALSAKHSKGSIAVDDVKVHHGTAYSPAPIEGYDGLGTGTDTSAQVSGLDALTEYFYHVVANDGTLSSLKSETIKVTTGDSAGISPEVGDTGISATVYGRTISVRGAAEGTVVSVVNALGAVVARASAKGEVTDIELPTSGIYFVSCGATSILKTIVK
ncbi:MAG: M6 family metalloprotease domain-containing protein [Bacteroidales bacterium]|nr:M6 family metalloprotease domain-containing protein [Bacteroidales bacterium]